MAKEKNFKLKDERSENEKLIHVYTEDEDNLH